MPSSTLNDATVTEAWVDLTVAQAGLTGVACLLQNQGPEDIAIVFGGANPGGTKTGFRLAPGDSVGGTAANVWARAIQRTARVSVNLT